MALSACVLVAQKPLTSGGFAFDLFCSNACGRIFAGADFWRVCRQLSAASMARVEMRLLLLLQILCLSSLFSVQGASFEYENDFGSAMITTDPTLDPTLVDLEIDEETVFPFDHTKVDICKSYPKGEPVKLMSNKNPSVVDSLGRDLLQWTEAQLWILYNYVATDIILVIHNSHHTGPCQSFKPWYYNAEPDKARQIIFLKKSNYANPNLPSQWKY